MDMYSDISRKVFLLLLLFAQITFFTACKDEDAGNPHGTFTEQDRNFAMDAAHFNRAVVEISQLAVDRATNEDLQAFARQLLEEHTDAQNQLQEIATEHDLSLPAAIRIEDQAILDQLLGLSGDEFNSGFLESQITSHQLALPFFEEQVDSGSQHQLTTYAGNVRNTINLHLQMAMELEEELNSEDGE